MGSTLDPQGIGRSADALRRLHLLGRLTEEAARATRPLSLPRRPRHRHAGGPGADLRKRNLEPPRRPATRSAHATRPSCATTWPRGKTVITFEDVARRAGDKRVVPRGGASRFGQFPVGRSDADSARSLRDSIRATYDRCDRMDILIRPAAPTRESRVWCTSTRASAASRSSGSSRRAPNRRDQPGRHARVRRSVRQVVDPLHAGISLVESLAATSLPRRRRRDHRRIEFAASRRALPTSRTMAAAAPR
jgi:hypothetical protein